MRVSVIASEQLGDSITAAIELSRRGNIEKLVRLAKTYGASPRTIKRVRRQYCNIDYSEIETRVIQQLQGIAE